MGDRNATQTNFDHKPTASAGRGLPCFFALVIIAALETITYATADLIVAVEKKKRCMECKVVNFSPQSCEVLSPDKQIYTTPGRNLNGTRLA